jgi:SAM-dependent methyltransferase
MKDRYTYGDNDGAAVRLSLLARAYEPSSERFLERVAEPPNARVVDLGCGLGHTTALVHRAFRARETWGLDSSDRLVAQARAQWNSAFVFAVHDVTTSPLPVADVDLFYARYLLTHVSSPRSVLRACATAARPGSRMILEEGCALESDDPLFADYYARVQSMHIHYGQDLYVGERVPVLASDTPWMVESFQRTCIVLDAHVMAELHAINIRTWSRDSFALNAFDPVEIASMTRALDEVASGERPSSPVTCVMGQAVLVLNPRVTPASRHP